MSKCFWIRKKYLWDISKFNWKIKIKKLHYHHERNKNFSGKEKKSKLSVEEVII